MRTYLYSIGMLCCLVPSFAFGLPAVEVQPVTDFTCEQAVDGTCKHFDIGDGANHPEIEVDYRIDLPPACRLFNPVMGVDCYFDAYECRNAPPVRDVEGHDVPGVVYCLGCGSALQYSITEAKCCLAHGQPTPPPGRSC